MFIIFLFLVALIPILYIPGLGGFEALKVSLFIISGSLGMIIWLTGAWEERWIFLRRPKATVAVLLVMFYVILRSLFVPGLNMTWLGTETSHFGAAGWLFLGIWLIIILNLEFTPARRLILRLAAALSLLGIILVTLGQKIGLEGINWYSFDDPTRGRTLIGPIGNSSYLGIVIALISLVVLPLLLEKKLRALRWPIILLLIVSWLIVIWTKSLSGIGVLILGGVWWLWPGPGKGRRPVIIALIILTLLLPVILLPRRFYSQINRIAPSLADRAAVWRSAWTGFRENPLFGAGIENFQYLYDRHYPPERIGARPVTEESAHSLIWTILTEWGLIGLLLWGYLIWQISRESKLNDPWSAATFWLLFLTLQFNFIITPLLSITFLLIALGIKSRGQPRQITLPRSLTGVILTGSGGILLLSILISNSVVSASWHNDQGTTFATDLSFIQATDEYLQAKNVPLATAFPQLEYAEAATNKATELKDFSDYQPVQEALVKTMAGAPTARNEMIVIQILAIWSNHDPRALTDLINYGQDFVQKWPDNPQFQETIQALRKLQTRKAGS